MPYKILHQSVVQPEILNEGHQLGIEVGSVRFSLNFDSYISMGKTMTVKR